MEKSNHIEDQAIDHLLKGFVKRQEQSASTCAGFDPDLASLYLERVLTAAETSGYESHLSQCPLCRSGIVALARLIEQEVPVTVRESVAESQSIQAVSESASPAAGKTTAGLSERLRAFLGILATPRFALAGIALVALAISIPFIVSRNQKSSLNPATALYSEGPASAQDGSDQIAQERSQPGMNSPGGEPLAPASPSPARSANPGSVDSNNSATDRDGRVAGSVSGAAGVVAASTESTDAKNAKEEAKPDAAAAAENKPRADESAAHNNEVAVAQPPAPPPAPKAEAKEKLGRIDPAETLRPVDSDKDAVASKTIKPGNTGGNISAKRDQPAGGTIRPGDSEAPPPPATASTSSPPKALADNSASLRENREARKERMRASASRKVQDKTFFLIDDFWTDQKYNKDKELPVVPVIRDSDVYKELLEKHSSLQKFFANFAANEKVLLVYKGTVYKLLPQGGR